MALPAATQCTRGVAATARTDVLPAAAISTSAVQATVKTPSAPHEFAVAAGSLWVITHRTTDVYRIDPSTNQALAIPFTTNTPESSAFDISAGPNGVFVVVGGDDVVDRIDTNSNTLVAFATIRGVEAVRDTPQGLWVASSSENGQLVSEIDPATAQILRSVAVGDPGTLASDELTIDYAAGSLWVAMQDRPTAVRIDPASARVTAVVALPAPPPEAAPIVATASAAYIGLTDNSIVRIDAQTNCVTASTALEPTPRKPRDARILHIEAAADRVRVSYGGGAVAILDPTTLAVRHTFRVDDQDYNGGVTSAFGSLWFSTFNVDTVVRLGVGDGL